MRRQILRRSTIVLALAVIGYGLLGGLKLCGQQTMVSALPNADFETGDLAGWTKSGDAFDRQPTFGDNPAARGREGAHHQGDWWIGGYERYQRRPGEEPGDEQGDAPVGKLTSAPFTIRGDTLSFLVGGGDHRWTAPDGRGATAVNLVINADVVRTATGRNSETMRRVYWDVSRFKGVSAVLEVVDYSTGDWGHVNFDDVRHHDSKYATAGHYAIYVWGGLLALLGAVRRGKLTRCIWGMSLFITGATILVIASAHRAPWQMQNVESALSNEEFLQVHLLSTGVTFSAAATATFVLLVLLGIVARVRLPLRLGRHRWRVASAASVLVLTLWPSPDGWGIVLYLLLGALGLGLLSVGLNSSRGRLTQDIRAAVGQSREGDRTVASPSTRAGEIEGASASSSSLTGTLGRRLARHFWTGSPSSFLAIAFAWVLGVTNLISYVLFERIPHIQDSIAQAFHGKIFLLGRLTVPSPEPRQSFDFLHMINNGRWYSEYPPGHSALLSLGHFVDAPWLINPLFGALCVVLLYFLGREMYDERTGRLAVLLGSLSPFLIFMSSEFMNHTTTLFFIELFLLGFARLVNKVSWPAAALAGLGLGCAVTIRPMTALAVGTPFGLYACVKACRTWGTQRRVAIRFGRLCLFALLCFGLMLGSLLLFNYRTNGSAALFGYVVLHGEGHNPGFGGSGWGKAHSPSKGWLQTRNNLNALNKYLFEWPLPSLLFVAVVLLSSRLGVWDGLLLAYSLSLAGAYFFYWYQDWCFGPRFLFSATAGLVLLTARGIMLLPGIAREYCGYADARNVSRAVAVFVTLCFVWGFAGNLPTLVKLYADDYWLVSREVLDAVEARGVGRAVVFVRSYYGATFAANHPLLKSDVIYVRDLGREENASVMKKFANRRFYVANGGTVERYP